MSGKRWARGEADRYKGGDTVGRQLVPEVQWAGSEVDNHLLAEGFNAQQKDGVRG